MTSSIRSLVAATAVALGLASTTALAETREFLVKVALSPEAAAQADLPDTEPRTRLQAETIACALAAQLFGWPVDVVFADAAMFTLRVEDDAFDALALERPACMTEPELMGKISGSGVAGVTN